MMRGSIVSIKWWKPGGALRFGILFAFSLCAAVVVRSADGPALPNSIPLAFLPPSERAAASLNGIGKFIDARIADVSNAEAIWQPGDFPSPDEGGMIPVNRRRFRAMIGTPGGGGVEGAIRFDAGLNEPDPLLESESFSIRKIRWTVTDDVEAEGLILMPKNNPVSITVCVPDADQSPEQMAGLEPGLVRPSQLARVLASNGCVVVVPALISRSADWSAYGIEAQGRTKSHRSWLDEQAKPLGLRVAGFEIDAIRTAISGLKTHSSWEELPVGVAGVGEGAMLAFFTAALDERIDATLCSGFFGTREGIVGAPDYRTFFGRLAGFDDAQIARLIAPRRLVVEYSKPPDAPGIAKEPMFHLVEREVERAKAFFSDAADSDEFLFLAAGNEGMTVEPGSRRAFRLFLGGLGIEADEVDYSGDEPAALEVITSGVGRERRMLEGWARHLDRLAGRLANIRENLREERLAESDAADWGTKVRVGYRRAFHRLIGGRSLESDKLVVRSRLVEANDSWRRYEVAFDVADGIDVWGELLVPAGDDAKSDFPSVVCLSDAGDLPGDLTKAPPEGRRMYRGFPARLAGSGFIAFVPYVPFSGGKAEERLKARAHLTGWTLSAIVVEQQRRILEWLGALPLVDAGRIGVYGIGRGGRVAMDASALLDGYAACIVSGAFNAADPDVGSHAEAHFGQWRMFDDAGIVAMIAPRPFMVERGHFDSGADDEWVAHEYANVRRLYGSLGVPDRTRIEFFVGPHVINGEGSVEFLEHHLKLD